MDQVETYEGARHGWVPTDSQVHNPEAAERHWSSLTDLYKPHAQAQHALKTTSHWPAPARRALRKYAVVPLDATSGRPGAARAQRLPKRS
jgi:dienelactone hydrolase